MKPAASQPNHHQEIRALFDEYIELYASRDDRLTALFSEDFSGYTAGGRIMVTDRDQWVKVILQDFFRSTGAHTHRNARYFDAESNKAGRRCDGLFPHSPVGS